MCSKDKKKIRILSEEVRDKEGLAVVRSFNAGRLGTCVPVFALVNSEQYFKIAKK